MKGTVDDFGRALLVIRSRTPESPTTELLAWVDTGFTGELVVPQVHIERLGLRQSALVRAELGDGTEATLAAYSCLVEWFGAQRQVEVLASQGKFSLLGVGLLAGHRLHIDYQEREVTIE